MLSAKMAPEPRHKTILPKSVPYYTCHESDLVWTEKFLGKGAEIMLGPLTKRYFNGRGRDVAPFDMGGRHYFVIIDEVQLAGLREKLEALEKHPRLMLITT